MKHLSNLFDFCDSSCHIIPHYYVVCAETFLSCMRMHVCWGLFYILCVIVNISTQSSVRSRTLHGSIPGLTSQLPLSLWNNVLAIIFSCSVQCAILTLSKCKWRFVYWQLASHVLLRWSDYRHASFWTYLQFENYLWILHPVEWKHLFDTF